MENNISGLPLRGPRPGGTEPVAPMSKARAAVLERLRSSAAPLTVESLAAETGQHPNTVREHLDALVASGLAGRTTAPRSGRGRPASLYVPEAPESRTAGYAALAAALARHIAATSDDPAAAGDLAGRQWARVLAGLEAGADHSPAEPLRHGIKTHSDPAPRGLPDAARRRQTRLNVATSLRDAGFGIQGNADATDFTLTTCPIVAAARENTDVVCAVHLGLVKGLLEGSGVPEDGVVLVPFAAPGMCTLHLPSAAAT